MFEFPVTCNQFFQLCGELSGSLLEPETRHLSKLAEIFYIQSDHKLQLQHQTQIPSFWA